jgi:hypothetical protein
MHILNNNNILLNVLWRIDLKTEIDYNIHTVTEKTFLHRTENCKGMVLAPTFESLVGSLPPN